MWCTHCCKLSGLRAVLQPHLVALWFPACFQSAELEFCCWVAATSRIKTVDLGLSYPSSFSVPVTLFIFCNLQEFPLRDHAQAYVGESQLNPVHVAFLDLAPESPTMEEAARGGNGEISRLKLDIFGGPMNNHPTSSPLYVPNPYLRPKRPLLVKMQKDIDESQLAEVVAAFGTLLLFYLVFILYTHFGDKDFISRFARGLLSTAGVVLLIIGLALVIIVFIPAHRQQDAPNSQDALDALYRWRFIFFFGLKGVTSLSLLALYALACDFWKVYQTIRPTLGLRRSRLILDLVVLAPVLCSVVIGGLGSWQLGKCDTEGDPEHYTTRCPDCPEFVWATPVPLHIVGTAYAIHLRLGLRKQNGVDPGAKRWVTLWGFANVLAVVIPLVGIQREWLHLSQFLSGVVTISLFIVRKAHFRQTGRWERHLGIIPMGTQDFEGRSLAGTESESSMASTFTLPRSLTKTESERSMASTLVSPGNETAVLTRTRFATIGDLLEHLSASISEWLKCLTEFKEHVSQGQSPSDCYDGDVQKLFEQLARFASVSANMIPKRKAALEIWQTRVGLTEQEVQDVQRTLGESTETRCPVLDLDPEVSSTLLEKFGSVVKICQHNLRSDHWQEVLENIEVSLRAIQALAAQHRAYIQRQ
ncbi:hypothetical protein V8F06_014059 [Rhypophila decipiens]